MSAPEYLVEARGHDARWFVLGSYRCSGDAQDFMRAQRKLFSDLPLRVTHARTRRLIVLNDPLPAVSA